MSVKLLNTQWETVDNCPWTTQWVGLSSGDIYENDLPVGHYVAAWMTDYALKLQWDHAAAPGRSA